jgi:hypothetical protein
MPLTVKKSIFTRNRIAACIFFMQTRCDYTILDGTRVKLECEMRCEDGSNIDEREIQNSLKMSKYSYD